MKPRSTASDGKTTRQSTITEANDPSVDETLRRLQAFLDPRIAEAERGEATGRSVESIFAAAGRKPGRHA